MRSSDSKRKSTWLSTTSFSTSTPSSSTIRSAKRVGAVAAALDQLDQPAAAERAQRGVDREAARAARELGHPVDLVAHPLRALVLDQVRGRDRHRRAVRLGVLAEDDPRVVGHVQPLVRVGRPRVGALEARDEVAQPRRDGGPDPERAVDVEPGARRPRRRRRSPAAGRRRRCSPRRPGRRRSSGRRRAPRAAPRARAVPASRLRRPSARRARAAAAPGRRSRAASRRRARVTRGAPVRPLAPTSQPTASSTCQRAAASPVTCAICVPVTKPIDDSAGSPSSSTSHSRVTCSTTEADGPPT